MRIIYLHGFASGPESRKASIFRSRIEAAGIPVAVPALDGGNFFNLTITGQYEILKREAAGESVVLIGSSMGGYLASLYASRHPEVKKLILLAPAFGFQDRWPGMIGLEKFQEWEETGALEVYHFAAKEPRKVGWQLAADARTWPSVPDFGQPALIFHGRGDTTVPPSASEAYAAAHPNVSLHLFEAGHELTEVLDEMWTLTADFVGIGRE